MRYMQDADPPNELSPDLEWMLQSGQVSLGYLMHSLASTYYEPLFRLSLVMLGSREAALLAVQRIFLLAASQLHTYRSETGIDLWMYGLAWSQILSMERSEQRWRTLESVLRMPGQFTADPAWAKLNPEERQLFEQLRELPGPERRALILSSLPGWSIERAATLLKITPAGAETAIARGLERMNGSDRDENPDKRAASLSEAINHLWAGASPPDYDESFLVGNVERYARRTNLFRQGYGTVKEIFVLVLGLVLIGLLVWGGSRFFLGSDAGQLPEFQPLPTLPQEQVERQESFAPPSIPTPTRTRQPAPTSTLVPTATPTATPAGVFYLTSLGESLEDVADLFDVSVDELRSLNRIAPEDRLARWQRLIIPGWVHPQPPQATPVTPFPAREALGPPVTSDQVRRMLQLLRQPANTVWMDVLLVTENPDSSRESLELSRMQVWFSRSQYLLITGPAGGWPAEVMVNNGEASYVARPGAGNRWFERISPRAYEEPIDIKYLFGLSLLFSESERLRGAQYELLGEGEVAGRPVWVVSQTSDLGGRRSLLWIDQQTGLLLRNTRLNDETLAEAFDVPLPRDSIVMEFAVDVDFPQELFDTELPWRGSFARDHTGLVEPEGAIFPAWEIVLETDEPQAADVQQESSTRRPETASVGALDDESRLSFRFPPPVSTVLNRTTARTNLYLGGEYIASLDLGLPWDLWCQRSIDGDLVVFSQAVTNPEIDSGPIDGPHYLRLSQPTQLLKPMVNPAEISSSFAISPDGALLAFWACPSAGADCGLYVHDTRTAENRMIIALSQGASNFVWSPDGEEIGLLGANESFFIVHLRTGELTYKGPYDSFMHAIPPDSPTYAWGVKFPPIMTGLDGCVLPPAIAAR